MGLAGEVELLVHKVARVGEPIRIHEKVVGWQRRQLASVSTGNGLIFVFILVALVILVLMAEFTSLQGIPYAF